MKIDLTSFLRSGAVVVILSWSLGCEVGVVDDYWESDLMEDADDTGAAEELDARFSADKNLSNVYQAESYTSQSGCRVSRSSSGYTGTGYMSYGGSGTYLQWSNVNVSSAGSYQLVFRYANGGSSTRQATLRINGVNVATVSFAPTGGWSKWATKAVSKPLETGANIIRLSSNSRSSLFLDKMDVASLSPDACPNDPNKTQPGECGCGVPEGTCGVTGGDASVRTVVHILRRFSLTTSSGLVMNNDHVTAKDVYSALASANVIWKRPELQSVVMNATVVEEDALNPSNAQELKKTILESDRDNSQSHVAYWNFFDPSKRTGTKTLHIYIVPFYGQTIQGVAMLNKRAIIAGSWSNKAGGGTPTKRNLTEFPSDPCAQSFVRTLAHEFGHMLTLQHEDCTRCIMKGCTDVSPVRAKALRGWSQYWR